jgi:hypothetical protein
LYELAHVKEKAKYEENEVAKMSLLCDFGFQDQLELAFQRVDLLLHLLHGLISRLRA